MCISERFHLKNFIRIFKKKSFCFCRILPRFPSSKSNQSMPAGLALSSTVKNFIRCAGISGTLAICLGVYGAHIMKENTPDELRRVCFQKIFFWMLSNYFYSYFNWLKHIIYFIQWHYLHYH